MFESGTCFQVFDGEFNRGVFAMEPVDVDNVAGHVGEEGVVSPIRPQFLLCGPGEAGAANNSSGASPVWRLCRRCSHIWRLRLTTSQIVESTSTTSAPGAAPTAHARWRTMSLTASNWRT